MKKTLVLVLLLAIIVGILFTGCTFIKQNDERVANAVLATVKYDFAGNEYFPSQTMTLSVTRSELTSYINYIIYLYSQYGYLYSQYGTQYDPKEIFESSLDNLISQKYQILEGMAYLMKNSDATRRAAMYYFTDEYKSVHGDKITPEGLLTIAERYEAIASTNESFNTSVKNYIDEYYKEIRELEISTVKENISAHYNAGYKVDAADRDRDGWSDGVKYAYRNEDGTYSEGLYFSEVSSDRATQVDYKKVYLKIILVKEGAEDYIAYLPVNEDAIAIIDDDKNKSDNPHITNKVASTDYEEPQTTTEEVVDEKTRKKTTKEVTTYKTHTAVGYFKVITPRTAFPESEDSNQTDDHDKPVDTYRYYTQFDLNDEEQKEFYENGAIFAIFPAANADDATKDAYRRFREEKKNALIGFTAETDLYNGLGYYYKSSFESAVLSAVQAELKRAALAGKPITDTDLNAQYAILAAKQKQEYDILGYKEQVEKFAEIIKTDLSSCYYIPIDALMNTTYTYKDALGNEQTRPYATQNIDGTYTIDMFYITHVLFKFDDAIKTVIDRYITKDLTDEDEIKAAKLNLILSVGLLNTNKSNENYNEESGDTLEEAYYVILDTDGNPVLYDGEGNKLSLEDRFLTENVKDVYAALVDELNGAADNDERLGIFKKYMTWYNDDNGSMKSKTGYLIAMGDIAHGYDGDDFPNAGKELYIDYIDNDVYDNGYTRNAFTSYGLHVEMISFMPFDHINIVDLGNGVWAMGLDADLDLEGTNFRESLAHSVEDQVASKAYSDWTSSLDKEAAKNNSEKITKKINKLAKNIGIK
ncbi:MAG TPA: hypothetical protein PKY53_03150 [Clostridia bacterium]|nr:hypothetical protein [Clostridia bacterium]